MIDLDEKLEAVSRSIIAVDEEIDPLVRSSSTPTQTHTAVDVTSEEAVILRKHADMISDWEAVQTDAEELRKELADDKWLVVFRTVTEQADNMMSSLEKVIAQCQVRCYYVSYQRML